MKIFLFLSFLSIQSLSAQEINGKWYMQTSDGLLEFNISSGSIRFQKMYVNLQAKMKQEVVTSIVKQDEYNEKKLVIIESIEEKGKYRCLVFQEIKKDRSMEMAWNFYDSLSGDPEALISFIKKDNRSLPGITLFHASYIPKLKEMKPVASLSLEDFKKMLDLAGKKIQLDLSLKIKKGEESDMQIIINDIGLAFLEMGFNPLYHTEEFNQLFKKYGEDPEVKKLMDALYPGE